MLRVDGAYLYDKPRLFEGLISLPDEDTTKITIFLQLHQAKEAVNEITFGSVFSSGFHVVHNSAKKILDDIEGLMPDFDNTATFSDPIWGWQIRSLKNAFQQFEAVLRAELQAMALYYVSPKGGFDNRNLIDKGIELFPESLTAKVPEAVVDVMTGARCLAFELWTAMGFHFHRANESVLRRYYGLVIGERKRPKHLTMGTMLSSMEHHQLGDANIRAALKNIIVFHRNPVAHPDHNLTTPDEAIALYSAIRAAIGYMLEKLPVAAVGGPPVEIQELVPRVIDAQER